MRRRVAGATAGSGVPGRQRPRGDASSCDGYPRRTPGLGDAAHKGRGRAGAVEGSQQTKCRRARR